MLHDPPLLSSPGPAPCGYAESLFHHPGSPLGLPPHCLAKNVTSQPGVWLSFVWLGGAPMSFRKLPRQVDSSEVETSWLNTLGLRSPVDPGLPEGEVGERLIELSVLVGDIGRGA